MGYFPLIVSSICGLLLILLVGALIINRSFRSDILGGEGEASVLGLLSIKGVAIVILCGLFLGGFIYPLKYCDLTSSANIENLIRSGLKNQDTQGSLVGSLIDIIESLPSDSLLSKKLVELAEERHPPFNFSSRPVILSFDSSIPQGLVGVCEDSDFIKKNIVVYVFGDSNKLHYKITLFADSRYAFPCSQKNETLMINAKDISDQYLANTYAKRTL